MFEHDWLSYPLELFVSRAQGTWSSDFAVLLWISRRTPPSPSASESTPSVKDVVDPNQDDFRDGSEADLSTSQNDVRSTPMRGRLRVGKNFLHVLQDWSVRPCVRPHMMIPLSTAFCRRRSEVSSLAAG